MSTVLILTPVIVASWPAITTAVVGAASALGLMVKETVKEEIKTAGSRQKKASKWSFQTAKLSQRTWRWKRRSS